jgi:hypothetical protein
MSKIDPKSICKLISIRRSRFLQGLASLLGLVTKGRQDRAQALILIALKIFLHLLNIRNSIV